MIELNVLTKRFGDLCAVDGISLSIDVGSVVGIVGPRGSGKSTLLRLVAGLVPPSSGDAIVFGASVVADSAAVTARVGYVAEGNAIEAGLSCDEYLRFYAGCFGVPAADRAQLAADLLELVDLQRHRDDDASALSFGMRRRLCMARALVNNPSVLLFDDPLRGLDPRARVEFRALLADLSAAGRIVLLTASHAVDVADLAASIIELREGRIHAVQNAADCDMTRTFTLRFLGDREVALQLVRAVRGVVAAQCMEDTDPPNPLKVMRICFNAGYSDAGILLRSLMHSAVQVMTFSVTT